MRQKIGQLSKATLLVKSSRLHCEEFYGAKMLTRKEESWSTFFFFKSSIRRFQQSDSYTQFSTSGVMSWLRPSNCQLSGLPFKNVWRSTLIELCVWDTGVDRYLEVRGGGHAGSVGSRIWQILGRTPWSYSLNLLLDIIFGQNNWENKININILFIYILRQ